MKLYPIPLFVLYIRPYQNERPLFSQKEHTKGKGIDFSAFKILIKRIIKICEKYNFLCLFYSYLYLD